MEDEVRAGAEPARSPDSGRAGSGSAPKLTACLRYGVVAPGSPGIGDLVGGPAPARGWSLDLIAAEPALRLSLFVLVLGIVALAEAVAPRRARALPRRARWPANLAIVALSTVLVRVTLPVTAVGMAVIAEERGWGLFHAGLPLPAWAAIALSVVLLDLAIYLQHVLFHAVPLLWRLHRMHHADLDVDATTGARFHPVEILLSMVIKLGCIVALGAPPAGGAGVRGAPERDLHCSTTATSASRSGSTGSLRWLVVTPDMHRVHHSIVPAETNSNFGFNLPWWDRLVRHVPGSAGGWPRADDARDRAVPRPAAPPPRPAAGAASPRRPWRVRPVGAAAGPMTARSAWRGVAALVILAAAGAAARGRGGSRAQRHRRRGAVGQASGRLGAGPVHGRAKDASEATALGRTRSARPSGRRAAAPHDDRTAGRRSGRKTWQRQCGGRSAS